MFIYQRVNVDSNGNFGSLERRTDTGMQGQGLLVQSVRARGPVDEAAPWSFLCLTKWNFCAETWLKLKRCQIHMYIVYIYV